jgi:hypothetical protein
MADFRKWLKFVKADVTLGPHGLRILGYNLSKAANGVDLTVAHGGWLSTAHTRYERFNYLMALGITAAMFGQEAVFGKDGDARKVATGRAPARHAANNVTFNAGDFPPSDSEDEDEDEGEDEDVNEALPRRREVDPHAPPGFLRENRVLANGRSYAVWYNQEGLRFETRSNAWNSVNVESPASPAVPAPRAVSPPRIPTPKHSKTQCGNPDCILLSKNGRHTGLCRFADPGRRRVAFE